MLKQRIIATLIVKNNIVVQSIGFNQYLPIGNLYIAIEALNEWGIDEIIILDIDASKNNRIIDIEKVRNLSKYSMVPLTIGGGISSIADIRLLLHSGADKVCLNQSFLDNPNFIKKASKIFGKQCIVISIDVKKKEDDYYVYDYIKKTSNYKMDKLIFIAENLGAGEIFLNSVDNDGKKCGYDLDMIQHACNISSIPIIAQGGAKDANDFEKAIQIKKLSAIAASNLFHYTEHSVVLIKSFLKKNINYPIRLESNIKYKDNSFDQYVRLLKKNDSVLDSLSFETHTKEMI